MGVEDNVNLLNRIASEKGLGADAIAFLKRIMLVESSGNTYAKNGNSSAKGLFQFIDGTWERYVEKHHRELTKDGRYDPKQQIIAVVSFTQDNEKALTDALGRKPDSGELYLAHFLGKGGGTKHNSQKGAIDVILEAQANPNRLIKGFLPDDVLEQNKGVSLPLKDKSQLRFENFSVADTVNWANGKMGLPAKYNTPTADNYVKDKNNVPESKGDMVMIILAVVAAVAAVAGISDMFSGNGLSSPSTPRGRTPRLQRS